MKKFLIVTLMLLACGVAFAGESVQKYVLDNGQAVIIKEVRSNPIVTVDTWIKTGSINEDDSNNGVSHFLEHLFFRGSKNHAPGEFDKLLEGAEGRAAVDALAGDGDALLDALLTLFEYLDAEGGIGEHDVLLGGEGAILEHGVEDLSGLFLSGTAYEFLGLGNLESQISGREDTLVVLGGHLEVASEGDFIVAVDGVHDAVVDADLLVHLIVEAHLVEVGDTEELALRL